MDDPLYNAVHNSATSCDVVGNDEMYDRLYHLKRVRLPRIITTRDLMRCAARFVTICTIYKREKHSCRSVTFKPATLPKVTLLHGCFSCFLNCTNGTKSRNASLMIISTFSQNLTSHFVQKKRVSGMEPLLLSCKITIRYFVNKVLMFKINNISQPAFTCSKSTMETPE